MRIITWVAVAACICTPLHSQDAHLAPQYRYRGDLIPAARSDESTRDVFSAPAAKRYLDRGVKLWQKQKNCVSCHTHGVYMIMRPQLANVWGMPSSETRSFFSSQADEPVSMDGHAGSLPTKLAFIARGFAEWDAQLGETTSQETDAVLRRVFALQTEDGSLSTQYRWPPINSDSYHGTIMAVMAAAIAPRWREALNDAELQERVLMAEEFLRTTASRNDYDRLLLLWAASYVPSLMSEGDRRESINMIWSHQRDDGGWSTRTFNPPESIARGSRVESLRNHASYLQVESDGYQTGMAVVVLRDVGVPSNDPRIRKAVDWLLRNQRISGRWWTESLNTTSRFHYISYSGSAYACLALAKCDALPKTGGTGLGREESRSGP